MEVVKSDLSCSERLLKKLGILIPPTSWFDESEAPEQAVNKSIESRVEVVANRVLRMRSPSLVYGFGSIEFFWNSTGIHESARFCLKNVRSYSVLGAGNYRWTAPRFSALNGANS